MSFLELAMARKSIRGFTSERVPDGMVMAMLNAATASPSAGNRQPWHFYVVTEKETIRQMHEKAYPVAWFLTAPLVFVVCVDAERCAERYEDRGRQLYCFQDTGAAIQSMLLCAADNDLGTCWCGAFNEKAIAKILKIPAHLRPVALIPTGFADSNRPKPSRRPMEEVVTFIGRVEKS
jgi:Nitroreductase